MARSAIPPLSAVVSAFHLSCHSSTPLSIVFSSFSLDPSHSCVYFVSLILYQLALLCYCATHSLSCSTPRHCFLTLTAWLLVSHFCSSGLSLRHFGLVSSSGTRNTVRQAETSSCLLVTKHERTSSITTKPYWRTSELCCRPHANRQARLGVQPPILILMIMFCTLWFVIQDWLAVSYLCST